MKKLPLIFFTLSLLLFGFFKIGSSSIFAQETAEEIIDEETELISPEKGLESSVFCNDFNVYYSNKEENPYSSSSLPQNIESEGGGYIDGTIEIEEGSLSLPNFSLMESRLKSTMPKLMPEALNQKTDIDTKILKSQARHYLIADNGACLTGAEEEIKFKGGIPIPKTGVEMPVWWTSIIGQTKIFCGIFGTCEPPEKLKIRIEQIDKPFEKDGKTISAFNMLDEEKDKIPVCPEKDDSVFSEKPIISTDQRDYICCSWIEKVINYLVEKINNLFQGTEVIAENSEMTSKTRGYIPYGKKVLEQSTFFSNFIPYDINSSIAKPPIKGEATYILTSNKGNLDFDENEANKMNYQEESKVRARYCLQICSLYPPDSKFNVSTIDPICISCNPKDYQN